MFEKPSNSACYSFFYLWGCIQWLLQVNHLPGDTHRAATRNVERARIGGKAIEQVDGDHVSVADMDMC